MKGQDGEIQVLNPMAARRLHARLPVVARRRDQTSSALEGIAEHRLGSDRLDARKGQGQSKGGMVSMRDHTAEVPEVLRNRLVARRES